MITRIEEWCERVLEARWFQWLLVGSVIYSGAWMYFLPRGGVFDTVLWLAVGLWGAVFTAMLGGIALALWRGLVEHFLPWDGRERRWRQRRAVGVGRAIGKS